MAFDLFTIPDPWGAKTRFMTMVAGLLYLNQIDENTTLPSHEDAELQRITAKMNIALIVLGSVIALAILVWIFKNLFDMIGGVMKMAIGWLIMKMCWELAMYFLFTKGYAPYMEGDGPGPPKAPFDGYAESVYDHVCKFIQDGFD